MGYRAAELGFSGTPCCRDAPLAAAHGLVVSKVVNSGIRLLEGHLVFTAAAFWAPQFSDFLPSALPLVIIGHLGSQKPRLSRRPTEPEPVVVPPSTQYRAAGHWKSYSVPVPGEESSFGNCFLF
ncbi:hypothetical protein GW7_15453 [Heterocephalus glaber]|uniref:Uncharacterized protein n=1 Tax=Heterocephalus glaber TaxID=10181 RepID=G5AQC2_HETGA|nr:hypothetical protein GW7_15453 [Heterocephalus glaber]